ncbi:hypothetical protein Tco_0777367, partial [Tanacetum coccineum]
MLDIQIQQDVPNIEQEPYHVVKVSVIPEPTQIAPSTPPAPPLPASVIPSALVPRFKAFNDIIQRSEVPKAVNKYLGSTLRDTLQKVLQRHTKELRHEFSQKTISQTHTEDLNLQVSQDDVLKFIKVKQEHAAQEKMPKYSTTLYDQAAEDEHKQKEILFQMMMASKSHEKHPTHKDLYDALIQSLLVDENDMDRLAVDLASQRKRRHNDKDQDPPAGSDQSKESAKGKIPSTTSKSGKSVPADKSVHKTEHVVQMDVEEPNLDNAANEADEPQEAAIPNILKKDWFKKSPRPKTLNPDLNTVKTVDDAPEQSWFNEMIQAEKPPLTFDELMSTPIDFSAFAMNCLKLNKITRANLVGPLFNLLKGTCKSCVELEYNMEECYRALTDQLDGTNPEGHKSLVDMSKPLPQQDKEGRLTIPIEFFFNNDLEYLKEGNKERTYSSFITKTPAARYTMEGIEDMILTLWSPVKIPMTRMLLLEYLTRVEKKSGYGYLEEIVVRRADRILYKFKEGDFPDLRLNDIEDILLLIAKNKLFNLEGDVIVDFVTTLKMFTRRTIVQNRVEDVQLGVKSYQRKCNLTKPQRTCPQISVKEPYTPNFDPPGVIYEDKSKKKSVTPRKIGLAAERYHWGATSWNKVQV